MKIKKCFKCGKYKFIKEFYKHKLMKDGYLGKCIVCCKTEAKERYFSPKFRDKRIEYEKNREKDPERRKKKLIYQRTTRLKHKEQKIAYDTYHKALRNGEIIKKPCEICGKINNVQAHHEDYTKPLSVNFLCRKHHLQKHNKIYSNICKV